MVMNPENRDGPLNCVTLDLLFRRTSVETLITSITQPPLSGVTSANINVNKIAFQ